MASPLKVSPSNSGRLSFLSSDIEEDLGVIDFSDSEFDYLSNTFWLCDDPSFADQSCDQIYEWINSCFPSNDNDDPYFVVENGHHVTPTYDFNRFEYLSKSVSRNATITRRKIDIEEPATPRFGTITKRPIQAKSEQLTSRINRTFDILDEKGPHDGTIEILSDSYSDSSSVFTSNAPALATRTTNFLPGNDRNQNVNTNTITKNRRLFPDQNYDSSEQDFIGGNVESDLNSNFDLEEPSFDEISTNTDLNRPQIPLNRTYDKSDTNNSISQVSPILATSQSPRNYPTISRNITRTLLRRETSQGQLTYSNQMKQPQAHFTTSNDDLLSSDSSSVLSARSNLTMTSSISGRSEPNLARTLTVSGANNQNKKLPTRSMFGANNKPTQLGSKIARPSSQNGPANGLASRKPASSASTFGSMSSLQSNMTRTSSQTAIGVEMSEDCESVLFNGTSPKLMSAISRNSTFRVHRPSPTVNVASVFADQPVVTKSAAPLKTIKYNSDDNILHCSQEEINEFRAKVLNSSNGNLRTIHAYQPQPAFSHPSYNNRSDSPSSNSSSCSSNSSSPRMRFAHNASLANRLNNNAPTYSLGPSDDLELDSKSQSLKGASNNNNHNTTFASANNLDRNGTVTNSKSTSRIPALPKSIAPTAPNRSGIPISGLMQPRANNPNNLHDQTFLRKSKLAAGFQGNNNSSKVAPQHLIHANKLIDDNSWQNDCF